MRFVLASLVVLSHSYPLASGTEDFEPLKILSRGQLTLGTLAVDCFFIISGFLILHSWNCTPNSFQYLKKRVLRIYPAFLMVVVIDAFVIVPTFSGSGFTSVDFDFISRFVFNALRLRSETSAPAFPGNPTSEINGSLWSISYEFWCYIGILAIGVFGLASNRRLLACALFAAIVVSFVFAWRNLTPGGRLLGQIFGYPPFWARLLPYFIGGMTIYAWREKIAFNAKGAVLAVAALAAGCVLPYGMIFALPLAASYLIVWLAFLPTPSIARFGRNGDVSYGIYLYSFPILQLVVHFGGNGLSPIMLFVVAWPLSIVAGLISWHLIEKHFVRLGKRGRVLNGAPSLPS